MIANETHPVYPVESPAPTLLNGIPDQYLIILLPIVIHWAASAVFEVFDRFDWLSKYRIHTSAEELTKNKVTRWDCFVSTIKCQAMQTCLGIALTWNTDPELMEDVEAGIAMWTRRARVVLMALKQVMASIRPLLGVSDSALSWPRSAIDIARDTPSALDLSAGKALYWYLVPLVKIIVALLVADAWMYTIHRMEHTNRWMYKHFHYQHHRLYVPYAWGGSYNHIFDSIVVDGLAYSIGCWVTALPTRSTLLLFGYSTLKNVSDHCGYVFPWDPIRAITGTDASFHDVHHQSWGLKTNFGAHLAVWDWLMGTHFDDVAEIARHRARSRLNAEKMLLRSTAQREADRGRSIDAAKLD
ncbi:Sphingolipid C4-hydroxylase sur2 [Cercospora beticola]|uniref:Sphingolipid C4-hydroxylase sur2 n=1 Tax=Cercospora beticola TaxID=122368 RepID=A0A2G5I820_CERBT|nr:Sphingolipid C4-hydroxylase sur2 [Cercospora beticola]PIB00613.1 Sphingolipid C4-hydroxylase sur2 [Cercospora beticola]WPA95406.1 hypothetical protein RHO25_000005 [Cercospora beticola]CAK1356388.1 unnamed protein product [Cercospora beticola]